MPHFLTRWIVVGAALLSGCATRVEAPPPPVRTPVVAPPMRDRVLTRPAFEEKRTRPLAQVLDVWMLDVGQGACIYIVCPDGKTNVMIDCGTAKNGGATSREISQWINTRNARAEKVTLLVTHGHRDHISHLHTGAIDSKEIDGVLLGGLPADYPEDFLAWTGAARSGPAYFSAGEFKSDDGRLACGGATFDLLTVNATEVAGAKPLESKENADSAVVRLSFAGQSIVFAGDAESVTEQSALNNADRNGLDLDRTALLISSHHGADTGGSNSAPWLSRLRPRAGLFSANLDYRVYSHPRCSTVKKLAEQADSVEESFDLACGNGHDASKLPVSKRLLSTFDNGHVRARFSTSGVSFACQVHTPACDIQLAPDEIP
jgi:beta-lactamase superfamily II metal-dependent hydrolase